MDRTGTVRAAAMEPNVPDTEPKSKHLGSPKPVQSARTRRWKRIRLVALGRSWALKSGLDLVGLRFCRHPGSQSQFSTTLLTALDASVHCVSVRNVHNPLDLFCVVVHTRRSGRASDLLWRIKVWNPKPRLPVSFYCLVKNDACFYALMLFVVIVD